MAGCAATPGHPTAPGARGRAIGDERATTRADDGDPQCASPYARLCGATAEAADDRASRHKALIREIESTVLAIVAAQLGVDVPSLDAWRAYVASQPAERRDAVERLVRKARGLEIARRVAPLETAVREEMERLRALALAARHSDGSAIRRLERATLAWVDLSSTRGDVPRALRVGCGEHLLVDDAWVTKDAESLTLCPGFLLVSRDPSDTTPDGPAFRERIAFLLAHELGHVAIGPTVGLQPARDAEVRADAIAAEILAADLEARSGDDAARYLARTLEPICSPEGDRTHPPGRIRIDEIVARHPRVAAALRCPADDDARPPSG
ncbi:Hypothetical protein I5071_22960 [Sandaracinus amylolyticus]|nr:Hypothetical protein I5071_22960 [Sandaracinus amylolyticus]